MDTTLVWLALASGQVLRNSNRPQVIAPWAFFEARAPETACFRYDAECFADSLSLPKSINWRFSQKLWDKEHKGKAIPVPLTNGLLFAWYSVNATTNCDGACVPTEFSMTRLATEKFAYAQFHGVVTNIARVTVVSCVPDPTPYQNGMTVHDSRFASTAFPGLVVTYNITNAPYPSGNEPWLLARVEERRLKMLEERRQERLKRLMSPLERLWNAIRGTK